MRSPTLSLPRLRQKFIDILNDVHAAEHETIIALPIMIRATDDADLKAALLDHLKATGTHICRLELIFGLLKEHPQPLRSLGMQSVLNEGVNALLAEAGDGALADSCRIVERSEISTYQLLLSWAKTLEEDDVAALLELTLAEEVTAEGDLSAIVARLNPTGAAA